MNICEFLQYYSELDRSGQTLRILANVDQCLVDILFCHPHSAAYSDYAIYSVHLKNIYIFIAFYLPTQFILISISLTFFVINTVENLRFFVEKCLLFVEKMSVLL